MSWDGKTRVRTSPSPPKRKRVRTESTAWNKYDPLFLVSVGKDDLVLGDDRVWAQGIVAFMKLFGTHLGDREIKKEQRLSIETFAHANKADIHTTRDLIAAALEHIASHDVDAGINIIEPRQEFWLHVLKEAAVKLQDSLALNGDGISEPFLRLVHSGVCFLLLHNPFEAIDITSNLASKLREPLFNDELFWTLNPILALPVAVWAADLADTVSDLVAMHSAELQDVQKVVQSCAFKPLRAVRAHIAQEESLAREWYNAQTSAAAADDERFEEDDMDDEEEGRDSAPFVNSLYNFIDAAMLLRLGTDAGVGQSAALLQSAGDAIASLEAMTSLHIGTTLASASAGSPTVPIYNPEMEEESPEMR